MTDAPADDSCQSGTQSPPPPLDRVRQEMERWLEVAKSTGERAMETLGLVGAGRPSFPAIDVVELDAEITVLVDLPGVPAEAVELSLVGNMLTIKATRQGQVYPDTARRHVYERTATRFERAVPLPAAVDPDGIRAETRDGLLTVSLHKTVATAGRSIPVVRGSAPAKPDDATRSTVEQPVGWTPRPSV